jgi:hypothetical protein
MESIKIILLCVVSAVVYGILHDQITARVCVEYFTIGHPPIFHTDSPTLLGLGWGVIATWWVGLFLGILAAVAARVGRLPKAGVSELIRPLAVLLATAAVAALISGLAGFFAAKIFGVSLPDWVVSDVPAAKLNAFQADLWAHLASYAIGFLGGFAVCIRLLTVRWRRERA